MSEYFFKGYLIIELVIVIAVVGFIVWLLSLKKRRISRRRRPSFKKLYELDKLQTIEEFERKMIGGMQRERREVYVTAFCNSTHVLKVTANIGSNTTCRPSNIISNWPITARRAGTNRIRQYHNHPDVFWRSFPSRIDKKSQKDLHKYVTSGGISFESLLVYRRLLSGYRIKKYG